LELFPILHNPSDTFGLNLIWSTNFTLDLPSGGGWKLGWLASLTEKKKEEEEEEGEEESELVFLVSRHWSSALLFI
jgi:hypothetical protein